MIHTLDNSKCSDTKPVFYHWSIKEHGILINFMHEYDK